MSRIVISILVLASVSVVWALQDNPRTAPDAQPQAIEQAILSVQADMQKAAGNLDAESLFRCVLDTNKGSIIEGGRLLLTRQEALDSTKRGFQGLKHIAYTYNQKYISVISPTTALWVADGNATATLEDGREITAPFAETIIFVQRDGQWKVLHAHRSAPAQR
jgi:hypothetical protein